jgi:hypothetical protein
MAAANPLCPFRRISPGSVCCWKAVQRGRPGGPSVHVPESLQDLSQQGEIRGLRRVPPYFTVFWYRTVFPPDRRGAPGPDGRAGSASSALSRALFPGSSRTATKGVRRGSSAPTSAAVEQATVSGPGNPSTSADRADSNAVRTAAETPHTTGAPFNARLR